MTFDQKLDFLLNITKTSNSALAHSIRLDASYISRLRNGRRKMPKDRQIVQGMATYLAHRFTEEYQKKTLIDTLKLTVFPEDSDLLAKELIHWLLYNGLENSLQVGEFLREFPDIHVGQMEYRSSEDCRLPFSDKDISVYYGIKGKQQAAEYFLSEVAAQQTPQTLLLFSDEGTGWMIEDAVFMRRWAELMQLVLAKGNKIKIIHTISRDLDEMLNAINHWMPLYMSGSIEPYFYPKKRDGIFKRTLFIAPETAAVISNSVGNQELVAANILYRHRDAVKSFAEEFLQYLNLCRPLMQIFTEREKEQFYVAMAEFERHQADSLVKTESLSSLTMQESLLAEILSRADIKNSNLIFMHRNRYKGFLKLLQSNRFTEIISLPDIEDVKNGIVKVPMSDIIGVGAVYYTPREFATHLKQILVLLDSYENYYVHLVERPLIEHYFVYVREECGVIVAKTSQPPVVLAMSEGNMVGAFWDFLKNLVEEKAYGAKNKEKTMEVLRNYLTRLTGE
jgi:hypothetical protein